jgi:polysaccharide export outer membrane protein
MKSFLRIFVVFMTVLFSYTSVADDYFLNAGDLLNISVWNEEALIKDVIVLPDGMISFPLAGQLLAKGNTVAQLQTALKEKLADYITEPVVTVTVTNVNGNNVHVMGKVLQPGSIVMTKKMDVMQALSLAGGLSPYAKEDEIIILRRENEKQQVINFDYSALKKGRNLISNILLKSGDVIIIP